MHLIFYFCFVATYFTKQHPVSTKFSKTNKRSIYLTRNFREYINVSTYSWSSFWRTTHSYRIISELTPDYPNDSPMTVPPRLSELCLPHNQSAGQAAPTSLNIMTQTCLLESFPLRTPPHLCYTL